MSAFFSGLLGYLSNPMVLRLGLSLIENILITRNLSYNEKALFVRLAQMIRDRMQVDVRSRFESEIQITDGNEIWNKREKEEENGETKEESKEQQA